jgi:hypothetical protein
MRPAATDGMHSPEAMARLAKIRAEIQRHGQSIVGCGHLLVFAARKAPIRSQFDHIFATAAKEGWSLEFRPDGTVRFANIQSPRGQMNDWEVRNTDVVPEADELRPRASATTLR